MIVAGILVGFYGLMTLIGGLIGYFKAESVASLIVGGISGIVLLALSYFVARGGRWAAGLALAISVLIGARFLLAFFKTGTLMPHVLMVVFSLVGAISSVAVFVMHDNQGQVNKSQELPRR